MKSVIVTTIFVAGLFSCTQKGSEHSSGEHLKKSDNFNVQAMSFAELDSNGILMFPFGRNSYDESGSFSDSYSGRGESDFWNILFVNSKTNEQHLLSDRKILIRNFTSISEEAGADHPAADYIFYTVVTDDTDVDGAFTQDDPGYLFVSDHMGNQFRLISSRGYDIREWKYIKSTGKIFLLAAKDSNKDKKYDEDDDLVAFEIDIKNDAAPREVFSPTLKTQLHKIYDKHWMQSKK